MAQTLGAMQKAIFDWFKADQAVGTIYAALGGRLYYRGTVPQNVTWPYGEFRVISNVTTTAESLRFETERVQFSLFAKDDRDCAAVELLISKLRRRFDDKILTFSGSEYTTVRFKPEFGSGAMPANPGETDKRTMYTQDYLFKAQQAA